MSNAVETLGSVYQRLRRLRRCAELGSITTPNNSYLDGLKDGLDMAILEIEKIHQPT